MRALVLSSMSLALACASRADAGGAVDGFTPDGDGGPRDAGGVDSGVPDAATADSGSASSCPVPGAAGTIHLYDAESLGELYVDAVQPASDGLWATGRHVTYVYDAEADVNRAVADDVLVLRIAADGAVASARRLLVDPVAGTHVAATPGGIVVTFTDDRALWLVAIGDDWTIRWARQVTDPYAGVALRGTPLVAAAGDALFVVAPVVAGTRLEHASATGLHVARFDLDGELIWARRVYLQGAYVEGRHRPARVTATALSPGPRGVLLATRTTSFGNRWFDAFGDQPTQSPWVLYFRDDGEVAWQRFIDPRVGALSSFHAAMLTADGWLLGGEIRAGGGHLGARPFIAGISRAGALQHATLIDGGLGGTLSRWLVHGRELMAVTAAPTRLFIGRVGASSAHPAVVHLPGELGRLHADDSSVWYVGGPPACGTFDLPALCGARRPAIGIVRLPLDGDRGCSEALFTAASRTSSSVTLGAVELDPGVTAFESDVPAVARAIPELVPFALTHERLCVADVEDERAYPFRPRCAGLDASD